MGVLGLLLIGVGLVIASRLVRVPQVTSGARSRPKSIGRRVGSGLLLLSGSVALLVGTVFGALNMYVAFTRANLPKPPPTALVAQPGTVGAAAEQRGVAAPLPPNRIRIARIGADFPVALSDVDYDLRFQGVGWMKGSGLPGAGNVVLYGQLDGPFATFGRLRELQAGDEFSLFTQLGEHRYRVRSAGETSADDVALMQATKTPVATLITDVANAPERRFVVVADYVER